MLAEGVRIAIVIAREAKQSIRSVQPYGWIASSLHSSQ
jgi:hypothetical protein